MGYAKQKGSMGGNCKNESYLVKLNAESSFRYKVMKPSKQVSCKPRFSKQPIF